MFRDLIKVILITVSIFLGLALLIAVATPIIDHIGSDMHGELEWAESSDGDERLLLYHGNTYYFSDTQIEADLTGYDVQIGWRYGFPFPNFYYYTDGSEHPLYIVVENSTRRNVYVRSDYNINTHTFINE